MSVASRPYYHLSLCSGVGGIDRALEQFFCNCQCVAYVEGESFCIASLVEKMEAGDLPSAPVYPDLHRFPWSRYRGFVDIVSGGFPCQPFSQAGKRKGVKDKRHLWPAIRNGLEALEAPIAFFENVERIDRAKSPGYESVLHHVLSDLECLGYVATAGLFTAGEIGAPHRRRRWFVLALADGHGGGFTKHCQLDRPTEGGAGLQHRHDACGCGADLADANGGRGEDAAEEVRARWSAAFNGCKFPARPNEQQHEWEPRRTIEPGLGRGADGLPDGLDPNHHRVDRLRALGNAVVPQVAALAFERLWCELVP